MNYKDIGKEELKDIKRTRFPHVDVEINLAEVNEQFTDDYLTRFKARCIHDAQMSICIEMAEKYLEYAEIGTVEDIKAALERVKEMEVSILKLVSIVKQMQKDEDDLIAMINSLKKKLGGIYGKN